MLSINRCCRASQLAGYHCRVVQCAGRMALLRSTPSATRPSVNGRPSRDAGLWRTSRCGRSRRRVGACLGTTLGDVDMKVAIRHGLNLGLAGLSPVISGTRLVSWRCRQRGSAERVRCGMRSSVRADKRSAGVAAFDGGTPRPSPPHRW